MSDGSESTGERDGPDGRESPEGANEGGTVGETGTEEPAALEPAEAFLLLADETRVRIVAELAEAWVDDWPGRVGYADLMRRVGVEDSGRFNYHLGELVGRFVARRDDRYKVTFDGLRVYRAIVAGTFTERPSVEPFSTGHDCHVCEGELRARFEGDMFVVACGVCETTVSEVALPPRGLAGRTPREILRAAAQWERSRRELVANGVCPWCAGPIDGTVHDAVESPVVDDDLLDVVIEWRCGECGGGLWSPLGHYLTTLAPVVALFDAHGVDVTERPLWTFEWAATDRYVSVREDPREYVVDLPIGDGHRVVLDGDLELVSLD
jgi:hypothetical protein